MNKAPIKLIRRSLGPIAYTPRKHYTLEAYWDDLIAQLNAEITRQIGQPIRGMSAGMDRLLTRIQRVNQRIATRQKAERTKG